MAKKKPYRFFLYLAARLVAGVIYLLPRSLAIRFGRVIGHVAFYIVPRHRKKAIENLTFAYRGTKSEKEIHEIAERVFENLAQMIVELLQLPKFSKGDVERLVETKEAFKVFDELLQEGRGIVLITAHIGNWELLAATVMRAGYPGITLGRRIYYERYNQWLMKLRASIGLRTIYRDESAREIFRALHENRILGILPDQDIDSLKGIFVPFFGRPAYTSTGIVKIALATKTPMLPCFLIRDKGGRYRLEVGKVIRPIIETTREAAIEKNTIAWMKSVEEVVRRYPEQWAWMHNRWKTQTVNTESIKRGAASRHQLVEGGKL